MLENHNVFFCSLENETIIKLTFRFVSQLPVHKALPSADSPRQLIRPS